jgi:hypothetical protein
LDKTASSKELRFLSRVLRKTTSLRRKLNATVLNTIIEQTFPTGPKKTELLGYLAKVKKKNFDLPLSSRTLTYALKKKKIGF